MISAYLYDIDYLFDMIRTGEIQTEPRVKLTPEEGERYDDCIEEMCP